MLRELHVENVGVIADLSLVLGPGMTVLTGETGAGKTLVVEAIELLLGARADAALVRSGAAEARVEARFEVGSDVVAVLEEIEAVADADGEVVLTRVVPAEGRSRAYLNGRPVPAALLVDVGRHLVDLHGQHSHHALLTPAAQRSALDHFGRSEAIDALAAYRGARRTLLALDAELAALGGDDRERAREIDLLRFQIDEIEAAGIADPDEERLLAAEEEVLASAQAIREGAWAAHDVLDADGFRALGAAAEALKGLPSLEGLEEQARVVQDEMSGLVRDLRRAGEEAQDDPQRLETVMARRRLLSDVRRKYGESLADVLVYRFEASDRLEGLLHAEDRARTIERERDAARTRAREAAADLSKIRRALAPKLAEAVVTELRDLAMPGAGIDIDVRSIDGRGDGEFPSDGLDQVEFRLAANPGEPAQPLSRVASGGELARTMLAARVVLTEGPPTLVFDEVDAGIGGQAGVAVGRRLAMVARRHQVLCVTHLAQVAAFADAHVLVDKVERDGRTVALAMVVDGPQRVSELSRMLSGHGTEKARSHAEELLRGAAKERAS